MNTTNFRLRGNDPIDSAGTTGAVIYDGVLVGANAIGSTNGSGQGRPIEIGQSVLVLNGVMHVAQGVKLEAESGAGVGWIRDDNRRDWQEHEGTHQAVVVWRCI